MNQRTVTLSERTRSLAEQRAKEEGFDSIEAYLDALVDEDRDAAAVRKWMHEAIAEGLASPNAGELSDSKLERLVEEGIARASRKL